jgi:hypothetical protein
MVRALDLRAAEADSSAAVHLIERVNTALLHADKAPRHLRRLLVSALPESTQGRTACFIRTHVEIGIIGVSRAAFPHWMSYLPAKIADGSLCHR